MARLTIETTPQVLALLRQLLATGLFGTSVERVAEELLRHQLREHVVEQPKLQVPQMSRRR